MRLWFDKKQNSGSAASTPGLSGPRVPRHSGAWTVVRKRLQSEEGLCIVDNGFTSPNNINYLTGLGHSVFLADMVNDAYAQDWQIGVNEDDKPIFDVEGYLEQALTFSGRMFDVVLLWTALDFLPEAFVAPVVTRLHASMNHGGQVLAFFHNHIQGEDATMLRYHVTASDDVDMQMTQQYPIQRSFTNRSIERLFTGWSGHRQFLAKDSVSEVIMTR